MTRRPLALVFCAASMAAGCASQPPTAADVLALMEMVTEKVLEVHNVRLEPEIKIIGEDA